MLWLPKMVRVREFARKRLRGENLRPSKPINNAFVRKPIFIEAFVAKRAVEAFANAGVEAASISNEFQMS